MKLSRIILGASAIAATVVTAFAFRPSHDPTNGTLATYNAATKTFTNVACVQGGGTTTHCAAVTYYTISGHTSLGKVSAFVANGE